MTDANKEPREATPARELIEDYKDMLNREMLETQGKNLEDMTAREFIDAYQNMTPEEKARIQAQAAEIAAAFTEANRESLEAITTATKKVVSYIAQETTAGDVLARAARRISDAIAAVREAREEFIQSKEWPKLQDIFPDINEYQGAFISFMAADLIEYGPEIKGILQEYEAEEGRPLTFEELLERQAPDGPEGTTIVLLESILYRAQQIRKAREEHKNGLPSATVKRPDYLEIPIDKFNYALMGMAQADLRAGKPIDMRTEEDKKKGKLQASIIWGLDFDKLKEYGFLPDTVDRVDFRILQAATAIYIESGPITSYTQIAYTMNMTDTKPSAAQIDDIAERIEKLRFLPFYMDNSEEVARYKNYPLFVWKDYFFPVKIIEANINGQVIDAAVYMYAEPPTMQFARQRGQLIRVKREVLDTPFDKTDRYRAIEYYLIWRIERGRKGRTNKKILFNSIYERVELEPANTNTGKVQRRRIRETVTKLLDHYTKKGYIKSYKLEPAESPKSVVIRYASKEKGPKK